MQKPQKEEEKQLSATQSILPIVDIKDNIVITETGEMKVVLKTNGINFDLYDDKEKQQIIFAFQTFLNSLDFPIQILIQSRPVNIDPYIQKLRELSIRQPSEALKIETYEYIRFIEDLSKLGTLMDKFFYVIINYMPPVQSPQTIWQKLASLLKPKPQIVVIHNFEKAKREIFERVKVVASNLSGLGLEVVQLTTPELIELFFSSYNPGSRLRSGEVLEEIQNLLTTSSPYNVLGQNQSSQNQISKNQTLNK